MNIRLLLPIAVVLLLGARARAVDYRVEVLKEGPPAGALSKEVAALLAPTGVRVIRGTSRVLCDIWLCKEAAATRGFQPTSELLYPFQSGELVGVIRYVNKGADFRDQDIPAGVYTLRYDLQPMDGNHEGTSPTRDFLLLVSAEHDKTAGLMDAEELSNESCDAVGTGHPGLLCLQRVQGGETKSPSIRHDEDTDWWILRINARVKQGDQVKDLPMDLVAVGYSEA